VAEVMVRTMMAQSGKPCVDSSMWWIIVVSFLLPADGSFKDGWPISFNPMGKNVNNKGSTFYPLLPLNLRMIEKLKGRGYWLSGSDSSSVGFIRAGR
jgi:hypothetical protein